MRGIGCYFITWQIFLEYGNLPLFPASFGKGQNLVNFGQTRKNENIAKGRLVDGIRMTSLLAALRNIPRINVSELVPKTFSFANPLGYSSSLDSAESAADVTKLQPQPMKRRWEWLPVMANHQGPRNTIVLCHGLGFFDKTPEVLPRFQLSYWGTISDSLRKIGSDVIVARVPSTGTIAERARALHEQLDSMLPHGAKINFVAHSMVCTPPAQATC